MNSSLIDEAAKAHSCPHCGRRPSSPIAQPSHQQQLSSSELQKLLAGLDHDLKRLIDHGHGTTYSAVKVLFLNWAECNLDPVVRDETLKLQTVFREQYHFDAGGPEAIYQIPSQFPAEELKAYISKVVLDFSKLHTSKHKLLVVYYNGHGAIDTESRDLLISGGTQLPIAWMDVQRLLESARGFDILLIMDCCYAARTIKGLNIKAMEVLAAVSREVTAGISSTGSLFTSALIRHLQDPASRPNGLLLSELNKVMHQDPSLKEQSPNHIIIMGHRNPIVMQPLGLAQREGDDMGEDDLNEHPPKDDSKSEDSDTVPAINLGIPPPSVGNPRRLPFFDMEFIDVHGNHHNLQSTLDTGSDASFIRPTTVHLLSLEVHPHVRTVFWNIGGEIVCDSYTTVKICKMNGIPSSLTLHLLILPEGKDYTFGLDVILGYKHISAAGLLGQHFEMLHSKVEERIQAEENENQDGAERVDEVPSEELMTYIGQMRQRVQDELVRREII